MCYFLSTSNTAPQRAKREQRNNQKLSCTIKDVGKEARKGGKPQSLPNREAKRGERSIKSSHRHIGGKL